MKTAERVQVRQGEASNRRVRYTAVLWLLLVSFLASAPAHAQNGPTITAAHDKTVAVTGVADALAGPIAILDLSYEVETRIGTAEVSQEGKFAAVVKPALILGNRLVAVDKNGRRSAQFTVVAAPSGPVPGPPGGQ
jgi:hypothetical protein